MIDTDKRELRVSLDRATGPTAFEVLGPAKNRQASYRIANISRSGMFLESAAAGELTQGESVQFAMHLAAGDEVTGVARVRWVRPKGHGAYQPRGVGVQVTHFHENTERRYLEFLEGCLFNLKITDLMDPNFIGVDSLEKIAATVERLRTSSRSCAVVLDPQTQAIGMFTKADLLRICGMQDFMTQPIADHMSVGPFTLTVNHSTDEAYAVMRQGSIAHIPITDDGIVVGVLSTRDLVRYWTEFMDLHARRLGRNYDQAMSVIAHDLRTPIGLIQTTNAMLSSGEISPTEYMTSGFPGIMDSTCEMMMSLIDDILDVQRIKAGAVRLEEKIIDVEELVHRVLRAFGPTATSKKITLRAHFAAATPRIKADPLRLEQVLNNLVSNAIKFSPEGREVVVGARTMHSKIVIWVADNGPGIPSVEVEGLFKEFVTLTNRPTKGEKSTGLGLAITKRLVEAHGGTIEVETQPGLGTTFFVYLPIGEIQ